MGANEATGCGSGKRVFIFTHHHSTTEAAACSRSHPVTNEPPTSHILGVKLQTPRSSVIPKVQPGSSRAEPCTCVVIRGFSFFASSNLRNPQMECNCNRVVPGPCHIIAPEWLAASALEDSFSISNLLPVVPLT